MHIAAVDKIVEELQARDKLGDSAPSITFSKELLSDTILELARRVQSAKADAIRDLATAVKIIAPAAASEIVRCWQDRRREEKDMLSAVDALLSQDREEPKP